MDKKLLQSKCVSTGPEVFADAELRGRSEKLRESSVNVQGSERDRRR